jgi:signal transduction histidine kinase
VDARQGEVIFRCVQEALTNTTKHANASHCKIRLSDDGRHLVLSVEDDGNDDTEIKPGNGLAGMAERVAKIDGQLNYQNTPEGFVLTVKLPKNQ